MGEYAYYNGKQIKIGTCEQMYYLRADQVHLVQPMDGSVNPRNREEAGQLRFRFPFPDEDNFQPGNFENYERAIYLPGVLPPEEIEHTTLQFTCSYPASNGIRLSTPCPRSKEGKASGLKFAYNGYSGAVGIHSQRLVDGQLHLVLQCGDCHALWREDTLYDCKPILEALRLEAVEADKRNAKSGDFYRTISARIVAGYTGPNFWTPDSQREAI